MSRLCFAAAMISLAVALAAGAASAPLQAQQVETSMGIDADISGNTDVTLGTIDECVEISQGESHDVDVFIQDVTDLLAWEAVLTFEPEVLEVIDSNVLLFMAAKEESDVYDLSKGLGDGRHYLGAFDAADPPAPSSGSGVLVRVTIEGVGPGVSELRILLSDLDGDGKPDEGPLLRDADTNIIGDTDGDSLFDGPITEARIAVDASCEDEPGPAHQATGESGNEGDGIGILTVAVVVAGLAASVGVGGLAAAWAVRRRPSATG